MTLKAEMPGQRLAADPTFAQNAACSIAAGLGKPQESVQVTDINVEGRRLLEEDSGASVASPDLSSANSSFPAWRRLNSLDGCAFKCKKAILNIKYAVYLSEEDEVVQVRTKLTSELSRASFAQTLGIELAEKERSQGRNIDITSIYISTAVEVQGYISTAVEVQATPAMKTAKDMKEPSQEVIPFAEETTAAPITSSDSSTSKENQMTLAVAGGAFASRQLCCYAFLVIALVLGTIAQDYL